ncbi:hypothetical protein ACIBQ6_43935 [Nonomuraea sp. NPDC049655]|uniref:hypothetical protein n=1 Tax=Nonomuraea sp. NPDC049655 TaxID=3364355 RepID=UPI0037971CEE
MTTVQRELPSRKMSNTLRIFILSPIVLIFGSAIRLLIISNYDSSTAGAIASLGGVAGTLLGTLVPLIPPFFPVMAFCLYLLRMWKSLLAALIGMAVVVPAYASVPESLGRGWNAVTSLWSLIFDSEERVILWPSVRPALIFAAFVVAVIILDHYKPFRAKLLAQFSVVEQMRQELEQAEDSETSGEGTSTERSRAWDREVRVIKVNMLIEHALYVVPTIVFVSIVAVFGFASITHMYHVPYGYTTIKEVARKPWMPLEVIETKTVRYVGYSIAVRDGWHAILDDKERMIHYVQSVDVVRREICRKSSELLSHPKPLVDFSEKTSSVWRSCP